MRSNSKGTRLIRAALEAAIENAGAAATAVHGVQPSISLQTLHRLAKDSESRLIQYVLDLESQVRAKHARPRQRIMDN